MAITVLMHLNLLDEPNYDLRIKSHTFLLYGEFQRRWIGNLSKIVIFKAEATIIWSVAPITRMYE